MGYSRPALISMGRAEDIIASGMRKGPFQWESMAGPPLLTNVPAYEVDE